MACASKPADSEVEASPKTGHQPPSSCRVAVSIVVALFESLLFSGVFYGVASLVPMLESRGVYAHLCANTSSVADNSTTTRCTAVQSQVTLAFTITQVVTPFINLLSGFVLDRLGFRVIKAVAATLFGLGCLCFTLVQPGFDWLLFPGEMLLGISGVQIIMSNIQLAPMTKCPFLLTALISGLFDACTMVNSTLVLIIKGGVNSFAAVGTYNAVGVATIVLSIIVYPGKHNLLKVESDRAAASAESADQQSLGKQQQQQLDTQDPPQEEGSAAASAKESEPDLKQKSRLAKEMLTTVYFLMVFWLLCNFLRINYFFGSLNAYVEVITGDSAQVEYYSTIFGYFFLASPLISMLPGALLDLQKRYIPALRQSTHRAFKLNTVSTLSLTALIGAVSCLLLLANSTSMLIPVYIVIALHRAFLFATLGNYCISVFSPQYFGIVFSSMNCIAAPLQFLTVPLTNWLKDSRNANPINIIVAAVIAASLIHPLIILVRSTREAKSIPGQPFVNQSSSVTRL